jgi:hypothetical protein
MENGDRKNRICGPSWFAREGLDAGASVHLIDLPTYLKGQFEGIEMTRFRLIFHQDLNHPDPLQTGTEGRRGRRLALRQRRKKTGSEGQDSNRAAEREQLLFEHGGILVLSEKRLQREVWQFPKCPRDQGRSSS